MNYQLAKEIYGGSPWMVDAMTFSVLKNTLNDIRNGVKFDELQEKNNSISLFDCSSNLKTSKSEAEIRNSLPNSIIYVVNLNGPITKGGGQSSRGTKEISQQILEYDAMPSVVGGILLTDSGGGSTQAVEHMAFAMQKRKKPLVQLIERGGVAASAAGYIGSYSDWIISESESNIVGSYGTMIELSGKANGTIDSQGNKNIRIYATASTKKNLPIEEALNNDNYELIINEMLDPVNEVFLSEMRRNRPNIKESHLDGSVYKAGDVIGSLVDQIGSFEDAVSKIKELSKSNYKSNLKSKTMTKEQLKSEFPSVFSEVFESGVTAGVLREKDRVGSWMAHSKTDLDAVKAGIESGLEISSTARENFLVQANSLMNLEKLKQDSAGVIPVLESTGNPSISEDQKEVESFYESVKSKLK